MNGQDDDAGGEGADGLARTKDVLDSIWLDPWFLGLKAAARLVYLWTLTNPADNPAGLYRVDKGTMMHQTGLSEQALDAALRQIAEKVLYEPSDGNLWVRGRAKYARVRSSTIAKNIVATVARCDSPELTGAFLEKYGDDQWLREGLSGIPITKPKPDKSSLSPSGDNSQGQGLPTFSSKENVWSKDHVSQHAPSRAKEHPADARVRELLELKDRFDEEDAA